jgi:hypothetical protein
MWLAAFPSPEGRSVVRILIQSIEPIFPDAPIGKTSIKRG